MHAEDDTASIKSAQEFPYGSDSEGSYSDQLSSDLEQELYSRIYHTPIKDFLMDGNSNDNKAMNGEENAPIHTEICRSNYKNSKNDLEPMKLSRCVEKQKKENSVMSFLKECCTSTPICPSTERRKFSKSPVKKNFSLCSEPLAEMSDEVSVLSDDSIICIDSWDSTEDNLVTNIIADKYCSDSLSRSSNCTSDVELTKNSLNVTDSLNEKYLPVAVDSESSLSSDENSIQLSKSCPIYDISSQVTKKESLWHVDTEDLIKSRRASDRYYRSRNTTCRNCREHGHSEKTCQNVKVVKCYLCGDAAHKAARCIKRVCGICYSTGHSSFRCSHNLSDMRCGLCQLPGHLMQRCPDIWRRYHMTTSGTAIVKVPKVRVKDRGPKYCYNCGKEGHYGHNCVNPRFSRSLPSSPFIISYKNPSKLLRDTCESTPSAKNKSYERNKPRRTLKTHSYFNTDSANHKSQRVSSLLTFQREEFIRTPKSNIEDKLEISPDQRLKMLKLKQRRKLKKKLKKLLSKTNRSMTCFEL